MAKILLAGTLGKEAQNPATTNQEMDQDEDWAKSPTPEPLVEFSPENRNHTQDY